MAPSVPTGLDECNIFEDDDEEGWQEMPVVREDEFASGLDEEDRKKYHYVPSAKGASAANATGNLLDVEDYGREWRSKVEQNESEYTRLRVMEEDETDEVHLRTRYLFDEDKAMTPLSQMQATKNLLTEAQRIAYVGLCALTCREMFSVINKIPHKELKAAAQDMELWSMKIMGRLYYHMELETAEQKMIESLALHGVQPMDLAPSLMTTHTVANPEYDPVEARRQDDLRRQHEEEDICDILGEVPSPSEPAQSSQSPRSPSMSSTTPTLTPTLPYTPSLQDTPQTPTTGKPGQTTAKVLQEASQSAMPGVTTSLSVADEKVTLDIRWTVLCDLFLLLIADSVYDARSRVLLENIALKLGLGWLDVVKFESRVTEALEIQEGAEKMEAQEIIEGRRKAARNKRFMMLGLATIGGGLVIGLSAGLLAPVIGAGLGAAFTTIGITGTTGFLAGAGGAAVITTGGVLTGSGIAVKGMANRTKYVRQFDILPLHNNKRVNCILTVPGFMSGAQDDVRLPFSVLDPIVGDVFSVLWEPEMIRETGSTLKILTSEVLTQLGQTVLQATVMTGLMSALQWPIILTKLGYLIDNPWSNALDRARAAGSILADVLIQRFLGVRPVTLIGFSLGARVIFYALLELARHKAFGIVQDVILLGATVSASTNTWCQARSCVSGRFVNGYAQNDWVLNYLFRATSGGVGTVAGLRPVQNIPGLENVDVTDKIAGHMSYRTFMPLILDQLGFPVTADYFDEPVEPDFKEERIVAREDEELPKKKSWFGHKKRPPATLPKVSRPPSVSSFGSYKSRSSTSSTSSTTDGDLPPREEAGAHRPPSEEVASSPLEELPAHAGFNLNAIKAVIKEADQGQQELRMPQPMTSNVPAPPILHPTHRTESAPPTTMPKSPERTPTLRPSSTLPPQEAPDVLHELVPAFSRSLSLGAAENNQSVAGSDRVTSSSHAALPGPSVTMSLEPPAFHHPSSSLALSFGGSDGSVWSSAQEGFAGRTASSGLHPYGAVSDSVARGSAAKLSFVGDSLPRGPYLQSNPSDLFTGFQSNGAPGLSFGGTDGSITFGPSSLGRSDPWASRTNLEDKKSVNYSSNPWA